jgi:hypothetical protein
VKPTLGRDQRSHRRPRRLIASLLSITALAGCLAWPGAAAGEKVVVGGLLPWTQAELFPSKLPRSRPAPIQLLFEYDPEGNNVELQSISIELWRQIIIKTTGLPSCPMTELLYSSARSARRHCAGSLVGHGNVTSEVPAPAAQVKRGLLAFYDKAGDRRYILLQVSSAVPSPLTYVIPFEIRADSGIYGTDLTVAQMSHVYGVVPFGPQPYHLEGVYSKISHLELSLTRNYRYLGRRMSFLSASCPAPGRASSLAFPFMKVSFSYTVARGSLRSGSEALTRRCTAA